MHDGAFTSTNISFFLEWVIQRSNRSADYQTLRLHSADYQTHRQRSAFRAGSCKSPAVWAERRREGSVPLSDTLNSNTVDTQEPS
jgi:hypothetical protein